MRKPMRGAWERVCVVRNPVSARRGEVQSGVIDKLEDDGIPVTIIDTPTPDSRVNAMAIAEEIREGDVLIVAGGDGTGNTVGNACRWADKADVALGFLPYGNVNDLSTTFNDRWTRRDPARLLSRATLTDFHPIEVAVNGEYFDSALLYTSIGWTALACALFDDPKIRENMQQQKLRSVATAAHVARMFYRTRHESALPPFYTDDGVLHDGPSDVIALNGPVAARVMRSGERYYEDDTFHCGEFDVAKPVWAHLARSALNTVMGTHFQLPGERVSAVTLTFPDNEAPIPIEVNGEVSWLEGAHTISFSKEAIPDARPLSVLRTAQ